MTNKEDDLWLEQLKGHREADPDIAALRQVLLEYAEKEHKPDDGQQERRLAELRDRLDREGLLKTPRVFWRQPPALAAGLTLMLLGGLLVYQMNGLDQPLLPDISNDFYDYPQPKDLDDSITVRSVDDLEEVLESWKSTFVDLQLPYRVLDEDGGKIVEFYVGLEPPQPVRTFLQQQQLQLDSTGWARVILKEDQP